MGFRRSVFIQTGPKNFNLLSYLVGWPNRPYIRLNLRLRILRPTALQNRQLRKSRELLAGACFQAACLPVIGLSLFARRQKSCGGLLFHILVAPPDHCWLSAPKFKHAVENSSKGPTSNGGSARCRDTLSVRRLRLHLPMLCCYRMAICISLLPFIPLQQSLAPCPLQRLCRHLRSNLSCFKPPRKGRLLICPTSPCCRLSLLSKTPQPQFVCFVLPLPVGGGGSAVFALASCQLK